MSPTEARSHRIQELTNMALRGAKYDQLFARASQMVSRATAYDYMDEVVARLNKMKK